jgi:guanylate kinase
MRLRRHQLGVHFRRQHPLGPYIVDFCCVQRRLVVELDGGHHYLERRASQDEARSAWLAQRGFRVLRFSDAEVLQELEAVLTEIQNRL